MPFKASLAKTETVRQSSQDKEGGCESSPPHFFYLLVYLISLSGRRDLANRITPSSKAAPMKRNGINQLGFVPSAGGVVEGTVVTGGAVVVAGGGGVVVVGGGVVVGGTVVAGVVCPNRPKIAE